MVFAAITDISVVLLFYCFIIIISDSIAIGVLVNLLLLLL